MGDTNGFLGKPLLLKVEPRTPEKDHHAEMALHSHSSPYKSSLDLPRALDFPTKLLDLPNTATKDAATSSTSTQGLEFRPALRKLSVSSSQPVLNKSKLDDGESSKQAPTRVRFGRHIWNELLGSQKECSQETIPWWVTRQAYVRNFFNAPLKLEQFLFFSLLICVDSFLFIFAFLPIRCVLAVLTWLASWVRPRRFSLTSSQRFDLARCTIFFLSYFLLNTLDGSYLYHFIRGQASLKLYVIFNLIEIFDKLFCSFGQDIYDYLFATLLPAPTATSHSSLPSATSSNKTLRSSSNVVSSWRHSGSRAVAIIAALVYTSLHSLLLFVKVVTLNVSVNAYNNSLLTLLVSNNFVELKGIVFKSFKLENVFQIACSDAVERFQIIVFLDTLWNIFYIVAVVLLMEIIVDWLKHAFITRFNKMQSSIFQNFSRIIAIGVIQQDDIPDACYTTSKRIGFVSIPLACVVFRVFVGIAPFSGLLGFLWIAALWATLVAAKFLTSLVILSMSVSIVSASSPSSGGLKTEKLANTYAYDKVE